MKRCKLCKAQKPDTEFGCKPNNPGQLHARCRDCIREIDRKRHQQKRLSGNIQKPLTSAQKAKNASRTKQFYDTHPERLAAKMAVRDAVMNGERIIKDEYNSETITGEVLFKPPCCQMCGKLTPPQSLHAHHHKGYDHPLDVIFVCSKCHGRITALERDAERKGLPKTTAIGNHIREQREILNNLPPSPQIPSSPAYNDSVENQQKETNYDS
jgi:hypothetical protein